MAACDNTPRGAQPNCRRDAVWGRVRAGSVDQRPSSFLTGARIRCGPRFFLRGWRILRLPPTIENPSAWSDRRKGMHWKGVMPAITTCFDKDLQVDHDFMAGHCRWLLDSGCQGIVPLGS